MTTRSATIHAGRTAALADRYTIGTRQILRLAIALAPLACLRTTSQLGGAPVSGSLTAADSAAIRATSVKWAAAAREGRWIDVASTYTEDAVIWFPDRTVTGRAAILAAFEQMKPMTTLELNINEIEGRGDMAFVSGYSTVIGADGSRVRRGKYLDIRKRQPDGSWLFYRDMVNTPDK